MSNKRTRQQTLNKAGTKALAAAGVIAAGTQAYADPIRFENPGNQWDWELGPLFGGSMPQQFLDITLDAGSQGDTYLGYSNFKQVLYYGGSNYTTSIYSYAGIFSTNAHAIGVDGGTIIGGGGTFTGLTNILSTYYGQETTYIPEGVQTYLGAQIQIDYQTHYGWIGVVRTEGRLDTFAWGYESEPGVSVPAGAPEPGSLALLALGFCAAGNPRRRH